MTDIQLIESRISAIKYLTGKQTWWFVVDDYVGAAGDFFVDGTVLSMHMTREAAAADARAQKGKRHDPCIVEVERDNSTGRLQQIEIYLQSEWDSVTA